MEESSIIIQDDGEKTTVIIGFGEKVTSNLPSKVPKNERPIERKDVCPRCENKTLIETEKGQICTIYGWPEKEDARERLKKRKKALIKEK